jgi:hypothetical protein
MRKRNLRTPTMPTTSDPRKYIEILDGPLRGAIGSIIPEQREEDVIFAVVYRHRTFTPPIAFHASHVEQTDLTTWSKRHNGWARLFGQILTVVSGALMVLWQFFKVQLALHILLALVFVGLVYVVFAILKWRHQGRCPSCGTRLMEFGWFHCQLCNWTRPMPDFLEPAHLAAYVAPLPGDAPSLLVSVLPSAATLPNSSRSE